ncbi:hypothetical protein BHE74_00054277 [Ensete ventricosum]|nr:hypothetical protein BHE74_00054277 [Ensete ventricosum]
MLMFTSCHYTSASAITPQDSTRASYGKEDRVSLASLVFLVELKNGETYNGHLVNCDTWMNIHLREVICTSKVNAFFLFFIAVYFVLVLSFGILMVWLMFMFLIGCHSGCRMVIAFGGCLSVIFVGIPLSIFEFQMRYAS